MKPNKEKIHQVIWHVDPSKMPTSPDHCLFCVPIKLLCFAMGTVQCCFALGLGFYIFFESAKPTRDVTLLFCYYIVQFVCGLSFLCAIAANKNVEELRNNHISEVVITLIFISWLLLNLTVGKEKFYLFEVDKAVGLLALFFLYLLFQMFFVGVIFRYLNGAFAN